MTDGESLLHAIIRDPADTHTRLVEMRNRLGFLGFCAYNEAGRTGCYQHPAGPDQSAPPLSRGHVMATGQDTSPPDLHPLPDCPDYFITRDGRVFTDRVSTRYRSGGLRELKQTTSETGYRYVRVQVGSAPKAVYIHRAMATVFLAPPAEGQMVVRHLNGDPADNAVDNLAWGTQADNMADCIRHGRTLKGRRNPNAVLSDNTVRAVRLLWVEGFAEGPLAAFLGVSLNTVRRAVTGEHWGHVDG